MLFHSLRQKRRGGGLMVATWVSHVTQIMPKVLLSFMSLALFTARLSLLSNEKDIFSWYLGVLNCQTNLKDVISKNLSLPKQTAEPVVSHLVVLWICFTKYIQRLGRSQLAVYTDHWKIKRLTGLGIWFLRIMRFSFLFEGRGGRGDVRRAKTVGSLLLPYRTPLILGRQNISLAFRL